MALSYDPMCFAGVANFFGKATAAKTNLEDNSNAVLLYTAPANGAEIVRCKARPLGTISGTTLLYLFTDRDATNFKLKEVATSGASDTVSTTDPPTPVNLGPTETETIVLSGGERLYGAISVALAAGWQFEGAARHYGA